MSPSLRNLPAVILAATAIGMLPALPCAAAGPTSGGSSGCMVTVLTTNEDGSTDSAVRPFQAPCRKGQSNGDVEYYNPYTDSYETHRDLRIEPLVVPARSSTGSRTNTGATSSGGRSGSGSSSSTTGSRSSGAPCTSSATSSKAIKKTRSTASGRSCTSTPR
ncbi:hypothetical protein BURK2_00435 [Burkholderiales bacterium]|nr:MAG: hypothetical protein F9K47_11585 [Burkholderiales bacterium]CAG0955440.1 hypothetical protein BURK2_00435 [Burkholderiales bacterium]